MPLAPRGGRGPRAWRDDEAQDDPEVPLGFRCDWETSEFSVPQARDSHASRRGGALTVCRAGAYRLRIALKTSGDDLPGSPVTFEVVAAPPDRQMCTVRRASSKPPRAAAGTTARAIVVMRDRHGNACAGGGLASRLGAGGQKLRAGVSEVGDGQYAVDWSSEAAGRHEREKRALEAALERRLAKRSEELNEWAHRQSVATRKVLARERAECRRSAAASVYEAVNNQQQQWGCD